MCQLIDESERIWKYYTVTIWTSLILAETETATAGDKQWQWLQPKTNTTYSDPARMSSGDDDDDDASQCQSAKRSR